MDTSSKKSLVARLAVIVFLIGILPMQTPPAVATGPGTVSMQAPSWFKIGDDGAGIPNGYSGGAPQSQSSLGSVIEHFRPDPGSLPTVRVALISSGVDPSSDNFPATMTAQITGNTLGDSLGYGTLMASALLQLFNDRAHVTIRSYNAYVDGVISPYQLNWDLQNVYDYANNYDVVVLGFPPNDFLDPETAAMSSGKWDKVVNSVLSSPLQGSNGPVYGIPTNDDLFKSQHRSHNEYATVNSYRELMKYFDLDRRLINGLVKSHVSSASPPTTFKALSVIVPAGDLGPNPQTIEGLANLDSVITVGGYRSTNTVSPKSSAGPSIELKAKPDLLAPTGANIVLPIASKLANQVKAQGSLVTSGAVVPDWDCSCSGWTPKAAAVLDTSLVSTAIVAASAGALSVQGVTDTAVQKAALIHAAKAISGVPVWRQGAGVFGGLTLADSIPTVTSTSTDPLSLGIADGGFQSTDTVQTTYVKAKNAV
ncbi:MAG: S8 family serine peptidase, partial [Actinobacteria bacterium]|nr:S8 family serine peptidase [Actinomycetota bacterium]